MNVPPDVDTQAHEVTVVRGDARDVARALTDRGDRASLVYLDPPFAAERDFFTTNAHGRAGAPRLAYRDRWGDLDGYLDFMRDVIERTHGLLRDDGSLLLHCDHRASHHLAILCDTIFGVGDRGSKANAPGFRNELIWVYGLGGSSARCYPKKHDTILWYSRGPRWHFDPPQVPATSNRMRGQMKKAPDVFDVPAINNMATERTGYPTQKPLALLERLVRAHSVPGDLVVDLFAGSGTTAVAAARLGRRAITCDTGEVSIDTLTRRLASLGIPALLAEDVDAWVGRQSS